MTKERVASLQKQVEHLTRERDAYAQALQASNDAFMTKVKELSIIKRHAELVHWNLDEKQLCFGILEIIIDETDTENCSLWLKEGDHITLIAACGQDNQEAVYFPEMDDPPRTLKLGAGVAGWVALDGRSLLVDNVQVCERFIPIESETSRNIKSLLCLPIKSQDDVLGVVNMSHPEAGAFSRENEVIIQLISDQAALAFTNYHLFKETQTFNRMLEQMVTERTKDLKQSQERFDLAVGTGKVGVWDWDLDSGALYLSPNLKSMLGYEDKELHHIDEWQSLICQEDRERVDMGVKAHLDGKSPRCTLELRRVGRDGRVWWFLLRGMALRGEGGVAHRMTGSETDITEIKRAEARLLHATTHDKLTGLANRTIFMEWLDDAMAQRNRRPFALLSFDLDRFKVINDSLGHAAGDVLLRNVSRRVGQLLMEREGAFFSRLGGDEFVMLIPFIEDAESALRFAESLQAVVMEPLNLLGHEIITTVSVGIVLSDRTYHYPEEMMRDVDTAMNQAKTQGKASFEVFQPTLHSAALSRLHLENDLRKAVKDPDQFLVYYQPIVNLMTGDINGFEALVRWLHPKRGMIAPNRFIPLAEETLLIHDIGKIVLEKSCQQAAAWRKKYDVDLYLSVNLSTRQFLKGDLPDQIAATLEQTGLSADALKLELTESAIMDNLEMAQEHLSRLRDMDLKLLLDDFGTGYSSLSYLHRFPMDTLKIDASFVSNMHKAPRNLAIIETIKMLAAALHMDVVAEGVETHGQLKKLRELGCEYGQGFFFSEPKGADEATIMLQEGVNWPAAI